MEEEEIKKESAQEGGRTKRERNQRAILIEEAIKGLARSMALGKFPEIHKDDPN